MHLVWIQKNLNESIEMIIAQIIVACLAGHEQHVSGSTYLYGKF
jgi:hypothetical protein